MYFSLVVDTAIRVSFSKAEYNVTEGEKSIDITLIADAEHDFPFVRMRTQDGTARVNEITFPVTIRDDVWVESMEEFSLVLEISSSYASRGVIKGMQDSSRVTIEDDDSKCCSYALYIRTSVNTTTHLLHLRIS